MICKVILFSANNSPPRGKSVACLPFPFPIVAEKLAKHLLMQELHPADTLLYICSPHTFLGQATSQSLLFSPKRTKRVSECEGLDLVFLLGLLSLPFSRVDSLLSPAAVGVDELLELSAILFHSGGDILSGEGCRAIAEPLQLLDFQLPFLNKKQHSTRRIK